MNAKPSKDSGVENVLRGAMKGALESGMMPSQLLAVVMDVAGSDGMVALKEAMKCALDRGTKPDELINLAVEMAFKSQNQPSKVIVLTEQPVVVGNAIKHETMPERPVFTVEPPRKRTKTNTTEDRRGSDSSSLSEIRDSSSDLRTLPGIRIIFRSEKSKLTPADSSSDLQTLPGIRIIKLVDARPEPKPRSQTELQKAR